LWCLPERGLRQAHGEHRAALIRVRGELEQALCAAERERGAPEHLVHARARATGAPSVVTVGQRLCAARPPRAGKYAVPSACALTNIVGSAIDQVYPAR
jgi:hypothetical protein